MFPPIPVVQSSFGREIARLRALTGLDLRQFGTLCNVSHSRIHALETGAQIDGHTATAVKIARGLGISVGELIEAAWGR